VERVHRLYLPALLLLRKPKLTEVNRTFQRLEEFSVSKANNKLPRTDSTRKLKTTLNHTKWASTCRIQSRSSLKGETRSHSTFSTSTSTPRWEGSTSYSENTLSSLPLSWTGSPSYSRWRKSSTLPRTIKSSPPWTTTRWSASSVQTSPGIWSLKQSRHFQLQQTSLEKRTSQPDSIMTYCSSSMISINFKVRYASTSSSTNSWRTFELSSKKAQHSRVSTSTNSAVSSSSTTLSTTSSRDWSHRVSPFLQLKPSSKFLSPRQLQRPKNKSRSNHSASSLIW